MDKTKHIELAGKIGFNTEHVATNEYLCRFAEVIKEEENTRWVESIASLIKYHTTQGNVKIVDVLKGLKDRGQR